MSLKISVVDVPGTGTRLMLTGEIDIGSARALQAAIHTAVKDRTITTVVVDLADVSFIDSTGIAMLIDGRKLADACATAYRVEHPQDLVLRVLEITGVLTYLGSPDAQPA